MSSDNNSKYCKLVSFQVFESIRGGGGRYMNVTAVRSERSRMIRFTLKKIKKINLNDLKKNYLMNLNQKI